MKVHSLRVLLVEDSENNARLILRRLEKGGYDPVHERVETAAAMKKAIKEKQWDIILCDYSLPKFNALSAITVLKKANVDIPLIIVAGAIGETIAVKCMRLGAKDYIMKRNMSRLCPAIARELRDTEVRNKQKQTEEKLRREEQRFRALIEHSSDIIVILNLKGTITYVNPTVERVLGFTAEERIGARGFELVHPDDMKFLADSFNTLVRDTNTPVIQGEMRLRHKDGSWRTLEAVGSNLINNNVVEAVIVNYRDITEQKKAEEKLRYQEQRFRIFVENSSDIIAILNREGTIIYENPAVERSLGLKTEERIGASLFDRIHPDDLEFARDAFNKFTMNPSRQDMNSPVRQIRLRHQDGSWQTFESVGIKLLYDNIIEGVIINLRNITERKKVEEALKESEQKYLKLSIIDDLTQLYNSRHFYTQLEREIERSNRYEQPLTLLMLDLDNFKVFNDTYGHIEGDNVLSRLGQVVKRCLRETDSAYRYGGEEFTIMLPMTTSEEGIVTAKRIQAELKKEAFSPVLGQEVYVTVSIGLAQYKPKEDMKSCVNRIDQLMYQAKKDGRDRICSESQLQEQFNW